LRYFYFTSSNYYLAAILPYASFFVNWKQFDILLHLSKMKGLTVAKPGAPYELTTELQKPTPGPKQVLVKSLYTAINPVYASQSCSLFLADLLYSETFMQISGILVNAWPAVLGCDASGIVVDVGDGVTKFKKGDAVFGWYA
jgi:NADPH:quinone reductase-like Zn-dependent oxidoreductase